MASIRREIRVTVPPAQAWDALRDVGRIHERLVRGFVTDCSLDGDVRTITFANGMSARERIIDVDDGERRVVWSVQGDPFAHHNASVQAFESGDGGTRLVWIADLLPDALEAPIAGMIEQGLEAMKQTLEGTG
ncbi:SRPBCC family protein [Lysobacter sp. TAF61]|uniref:SRPBCC family protein n=1 Tax=Lysobacter sp. TAF61 TaxID=3233072 RepID=UPI003F9A2E3B